MMAPARFAGQGLFLCTVKVTGARWAGVAGWRGAGSAALTAFAPTYSANPEPSRNGGPDPTQVDWNFAVDVENRYIGTQPIYGS
jgi:hypothetical protein